MIQQQKIGVVGGCGHIGLPLGLVLACKGLPVTLIDTSAERVASVLTGKMPFLERGADQMLPAALASGLLSATTDLDAVRDLDVVVVTLGTPVDEFLDPQIRIFDLAIEDLLSRMHTGQLLILRSTLFPGMTDRLVRRTVAAGMLIDIAYCPERIAQGYAIEELTKLPQLVSGNTPEAARRAAELFEFLGAKTIELELVEAELAKLFANAYRYLNFAISNQFYMLAEKFGADFYRVHAAVTEDYPRMAGFARAGFAGGPCLLKDTMQLAAFNHNNFILGQTAMVINEGFPSVLVERVKAQFDLRHMTAGILGMAFKGNSDDSRDSLAYKLRKLLTIECRHVVCTDPYIHDPDFVSLEGALRESDILFLGACHDEYRELVILKPLVDPFGFYRSKQHEGPRDRGGGVHRGVSRRGAARPGP
jgi:UDP-N-acetyl-D-mannosaminuronic acid dehydrogenase